MSKAFRSARTEHGSVRLEKDWERRKAKVAALRKARIMKRYLLFYGQNYYPCGGWDDLHGSFNTAEEAFRVARKNFDGAEVWFQVVDTETMKKIVE